MKYLIICISLITFSCTQQTDITQLERRDDGLSYLKRSQEKANGDIVERSERGKIISRHQYKDGKPVGKWFAFDEQGNITSSGVGIDLSGESKSSGINFTNSVLSIVTQPRYSYATLSVADSALFESPVVFKVADFIFAAYAPKFHFEDVLMFNNYREYRVAKKTDDMARYRLDTLQTEGKLTVRMF